MLNEHVLVSIIIPVYNGGEHLDATLKSIRLQTYKHTEIIVVDDGSVDDTGVIIAANIEEDNRVRFTKIKNSGPALARNAGLQQAQGDFVMFVDGDDKLAKNTVERALQAAQKSKCDVVIFGFCLFHQKKILLQCGLDAEIDSLEQLGEWLSKLYLKNLLNVIGNKLYRREVLHKAGISFSDYRYGEDRLFIFDVLNQTHNIYVISDSLYKYNQHPGTLVSCFYSKKFEVCSLIDESLLTLASKTGAIKPRDIVAFDFMFLKSVVSCLVNLYEPACHYSKKEKLDHITHILNSPRVIQALKTRKKCWGKHVWIITWVMKTKNLKLNRLTFSLVAWVSRNLPGLFLYGRQNYKISEKPNKGKSV